MLDSLNVGATLQSRHAHLTTLLSQHLPTWRYPTLTGGQVLWIHLPAGDGNSFAQTALRHGIAVLPGAGLDLTGASSSYIRLHFHTPNPLLTESVTRLTTAWRAYRAPTTAPTPSPPRHRHLTAVYRSTGDALP